MISIQTWLGFWCNPRRIAGSSESQVHFGASVASSSCGMYCRLHAHMGHLVCRPPPPWMRLPHRPYDSHSMTMWSSSISAVHFNSACTERLRTDHVTMPCCLFTRWASRHQHDSDGGDLSSQLNALQTHTLNARFKRPFQTQPILRDCRINADSNAVSNAVSNARAGCRASNPPDARL